MSSQEIDKSITHIEQSKTNSPNTSVILSLIVATFGRTIEVASLLASLSRSNYDLSSIEVIIVDQNEKDMLQEYIRKYNNTFPIVHVKTSIKGLSRNRNIGLKYARGKYLGFPDDDCEYFPSTIQNLLLTFAAPESPAIVMGRLVERDGISDDGMREWPRENKIVTVSNFYRLTSSNTLFCLNDGIIFDEDFGVGARYGANEDADLILRFFKQGSKIIYNPLIILHHPDRPSLSKGPIVTNKAFNYGVGFGALCRKHFSIIILKLFILSLAFHILKGIIALGKGDFLGVRMRFFSFLGRIYGFLLYGY